jgi:hypothetical protein
VLWLRLSRSVDVAVRLRASTFVVTASVCACVVSGCGGGNNVPDGASLVQVLSAAPGAQPYVAVTVTKPSTTRRVLTWINRLHPVPHGVYNCPAFTAVEPTVTLTFRAHARGPVIAKASETDYGYGSGPCNALTVTSPGHKTRFLIGGQFLEQLERLLDVNFGFGEGSIRGAIYMAGGPAPSKKPIAGEVRLYLAHRPSHYSSAALSNETLPQPGKFGFSGVGPGDYYLRASVHGKPSGCPRTAVTVRAGTTTIANVPWGCNIK